MLTNYRTLLDITDVSVPLSRTYNHTNKSLQPIYATTKHTYNYIDKIKSN